ncbi:glutathione peroxidase [Jannaschia sp. 2305UL9-9]|uniref:glutathione peroxidase n=1 Tax=Jannaschia sp. 2305UL9-9 TaxID=3121638 RepID=UPI00352790AD
MLRLVALLLTALPAHAWEFDALEGGTIDLAAPDGQAVLVVNTASLCGFTHQYAGLQTLHERYADRGLTVLAVPSDDFAQELDSEDAVADFCEVNYGLTFPMTTITRVRGADAHPFYAWLADQGARPRWNFNKALIDPQGQLVTFEGSGTGPLSRRMIGAIESVLPR